MINLNNLKTISDVKLYSHNKHSEGAKLLAEKLGVKRLKHEGSKFKGDEKSVLINWGSSNIKHPMKNSTQAILNPEQSVKTCANKLSFFSSLYYTDKGTVDTKLDKFIPAFVTTKAEAEEMMKTLNCSVVCRTTLTGSAGDGIIIADTPDQLVDCKLYVEYVKKKNEFRIHTIMDNITPVLTTFVQRKSRSYKVPIEKINWQIRTHNNGFIFAHHDVHVPDEVFLASQLAHTKLFNTCGLNFGAFDIVYNEKENRSAILECNTAPGLEGQTIEIYGKYIEKLINDVNLERQVTGAPKPKTVVVPTARLPRLDVNWYNNNLNDEDL